MRTPLRERKALLEDLLTGVDAKGPLRYSDHVVGHGDQFFRSVEICTA